MRKFLLTFLFLILFCGCLNNTKIADDKPNINNKLNINNFWVYYGSDNIEKLSKYDLVIIEPYNYKKEDIQKLKLLNPNIKVIAYLSIGEVSKDRPYFKECQKIIIGKNQNWNSYYINISSPIWQKIILNEVKKFKNMGFDGVFLDTVDSAIYTNQKNEVIELIKKIREENPDIIIIQNRGFEIIEKTAPYIDGVLFEDFTTHYDFKNKKAYYWEGSDLNWINAQSERLKNLKEKYHLVILTLDYVNDIEMTKKCIEHAKKYNFIPMTTKDITLNSIN
ncbi:endo alpha-1,4 polygalactosaminidase [Methanocaldococcus villosus]|uniref:endo alpha-1,4 polygalactosaminidase n=1 Tax=Methanocaldococcus villosus TaxID=667126 RepID=UPI0003775C79|nr:endo alpha-1,4 polygalactosaminidase [Methanocaldococcus villosus]